MQQVQKTNFGLGVLVVDSFGYLGTGTIEGGNNIINIYSTGKTTTEINNNYIIAGTGYFNYVGASTGYFTNLLTISNGSS